MVASSRNHYYKNSLLLKRYLVRVGSSTEEEHSLSQDSLDDSVSRPLTSDEVTSFIYVPLLLHIDICSLHDERNLQWRLIDVTKISPWLL